MLTIVFGYSSFMYGWLKIIFFVFEMLFSRWYLLKVEDNKSSTSSKFVFKKKKRENYIFSISYLSKVCCPTVVFLECVTDAGILHFSWRDLMPIFVHLSRKTCITKYINKLKSGGDSGVPCQTIQNCNQEFELARLFANIVILSVGSVSYFICFPIVSDSLTISRVNSLHSIACLR